MTVGIRELKNKLSHYVRKAEAGERVIVTAQGRIVAELVPRAAAATMRSGTRFDALVAEGVVVPASQHGDPTDGWPVIRMAPGSVRHLIIEDRGGR
jgi:prevent-host-death family protein